MPCNHTNYRSKIDDQSFGVSYWVVKSALFQSYGQIKLVGTAKTPKQLLTSLSFNVSDNVQVSDNGSQISIESMFLNFLSS